MSRAVISESKYIAAATKGCDMAFIKIRVNQLQGLAVLLFFGDRVKWKAIMLANFT